jgi:hypothetical protein
MIFKELMGSGIKRLLKWLILRVMDYLFLENLAYLYWIQH